MKPTLQAIVLADHIYRDGATGKHVICGTFNRVILHRKVVREEVAEDGTRRRVQSVGPQAGSPYLYVNITNVRKQITLALRFVNLDDNRAIFEVPFLVKAESPLDTIEASIVLPILPIGEPGVYALELLHNDDPLGCLRVTAVPEPDADEESK